MLIFGIILVIFGGVSALIGGLIASNEARFRENCVRGQAQIEYYGDYGDSSIPTMMVSLVGVEFEHGTYSCQCSNSIDQKKYCPGTIIDVDYVPKTGRTMSIRMVDCPPFSATAACKSLYVAGGIMVFLGIILMICV